MNVDIQDPFQYRGYTFGEDSPCRAIQSLHTETRGMESVELNLTVESRTAREPVLFPVQRLVCAGWVGRDKRFLQAHIDELAQHGVPAPTRVPIYLNFSPSLTTTSDVVYVISPETSGEVEYVVLKGADRTYVGVGSDHTDRGFEKFSIPASKHLYSKIPIHRAA
jgi:hypothetical protein